MTWRVNDCETAFYVESDCGKEVCAINTFEGGYLRRFSTDDAKVNARLISAAPDMLAALEAIKPLVDMLYGQAQADKTKLISHAINKAKGV